MKGYWIGHLDVHNPEPHLENYVPLSTAAVHKYGGKFLIRGGQCQIVEGSFKDRQVVIEFPSYKQALMCYESEEYQNARSQREDTAVADIIVVEGAD